LAALLACTPLERLAECNRFADEFSCLGGVYITDILLDNDATAAAKALGELDVD
jgi:hypothetical protein